MSYVVEALCHKRRFGSAVRKQIIMFLANRASDDGSGIYCSKGYIQRHTELGETTVKRTVAAFLREGILVETGQRRRCKNGYTVVYRIDLAVVRGLDPVFEPDDPTTFQTGSTEDGVQPGPGTGSPEDGVRGPQRTPNNPKTTLKPPTRTRDPEVEGNLEKIWAAYPEDRRRNRTDTLRLAEAALAEVEPAELLAAVKSYASQSAGFTRSKVSFSDNWFKQGKWRDVVKASPVAAYTPEEIAAKQLDDTVKAIRDKIAWMYAHLQENVVATAVQRRLITLADARAAGFLT